MIVPNLQEAFIVLPKRLISGFLVPIAIDSYTQIKLHCRLGIIFLNFLNNYIEILFGTCMPKFLK